MTEPKPCDDCKQIIQYHEGINKVVNLYDGVGGKRGNDHICPKRIGSKFHKVEPVDPRKQYLITYADSCCGFPHYMGMACPMHYDRNGKWIQGAPDTKAVKTALLPNRFDKKTRQLEVMNEDTGIYEQYGDIHDPESWHKFADKTRELINILNLKPVI